MIIKMEQFPTEITVAIFGHLGTCELMRARAVCRSFNDVICGMCRKIMLILCDKRIPPTDYIIGLLDYDNILRIRIYKEDMGEAAKLFIRRLNPANYIVHMIRNTNIAFYNDFIKGLIPGMDQVKWWAGLINCDYKIGWNKTPKFGNKKYKYYWRVAQYERLIIGSCFYYPDKS